MPARILHQLGRLRRDRQGGVLLLFALGLPALLMGAGVAVDYGKMAEQRLAIQTAADSAALAGAREFRLANASAATVQTVAERFASTALAQSDLTAIVKAAVDSRKMTVSVEISAVAKTHVMHMFGTESVALDAHATARVFGSTAICVIGLEQKKNETIYLEKDAKLEAPDCAVYSNSLGKDGLKAKENSQLKARFICSAGGKYKDKYDSFQPDPMVDCPVVPDPLLSREPPPVGGCNSTGLKITASTTLSPGTYCGGLIVSKGAVVTLNPGVYAFKDGPLDVSGGATLMGQNVGLYFNGKNSAIRFDADTKIDLTAPRDGPLAGILFYEDRKSPPDQRHEILSNDAKVLLGTIYLPTGVLNVAANKPVAAESAYTIVIAKRFTLSAGPTMVINARYSQTNIPVPDGVGPGSTTAHLMR